MPHFLAWSPRHFPCVFNLDIHVLVNCQLSKKVSADQCHMTVSSIIEVTYLSKLSPKKCLKLIAGSTWNSFCFLLAVKIVPLEKDIS